MYGHGKAPHRATLYAGSASMPRPWIPFGLNSEAWEKRGHIYRTGSLTQGTNEAHRFPCCSARYRCSPSEPQRTRDAHYCAPPAQIPACGIPASGSHLGCLTAKRTLGHGMWSFAACRTRSSPWDMLVRASRSPWPLPLAPPTPPDSCLPLFAGFTATTKGSDFSCPCIVSFDLPVFLTRTALPQTASHEISRFPNKRFRRRARASDHAGPARRSR